MKVYLIISFDYIRQYNHTVLTVSELYADHELRRMLRDHTGTTPIPTDTTPDDLIDWYNTHFDDENGRIAYHVLDADEDIALSLCMCAEGAAPPQSLIDRLREQQKDEEIAQAARDLEAMVVAGHA